MFIEITNYHFKGAEEKANGLTYIANTITAYESAKKGYINSIIVEGEENDIVVMDRFEVKQNRAGSGVDREGYKMFAALWSKTPDVVSGNNRANKEFQRSEMASA